MSEETGATPAVEGKKSQVPKVTRPTTPPPEADKTSFATQFMGSLKRIMEDVTTLDVATYVTYGDEEGEIKVEVAGSEYPAYLQAYTRISLDADTIALLPAKKQGEDIVVREELYDIHMEHVEQAKATRQAMLDSMFGAIGSVLKIFGD